MTTYKIFLIGQQGSGKGTQAQCLSKTLNLPIITPGNIFREEKANGTKLGKIVAGFIDNGVLVPDDITNAIVKQRLNLEEYKHGFILDGYPRNENQALALAEITSLTHVIEIDIPDKTVIERLSNRFVCPKGHIYNTISDPPKQPGICNIDMEPLYQRDDDKEYAIKKRLEIYKNETSPIIQRYKKQGIHHYVDGTKTIEDVRLAIEKIVGDPKII